MLTAEELNTTNCTCLYVFYNQAGAMARHPTLITGNGCVM